ncbi:MAG: 50S ribosomal protein L25 [Lentisphaeraceae bacterium]|nr:50S ribosomal protein L25 [Lentisphaeraceae bacterium]
MAIILKAQERTVKGKKVKTLRREGLVPGEVYGRGGDNISIQITQVDLVAAIRLAGSTQVISIEVGDKSVDVLLKDSTRSLDRKSITHVDFYSIDENTAVKAVVPVTVVGDSVLIARGGVAVTGATSIEIAAIPANIPTGLTVSLEQLVEFSDIICAGDVVLGEGVELVSNTNTMLAYVSQTRASRSAAAEEREEA